MRSAPRTSVIRQVTQIIHLVDDLLDVSRIAQGKINLRRTRFDLAEAIQFAIETNQPFVEQRKHRFVVSLPEEKVYLREILHEFRRYSPTSSIQPPPTPHPAASYSSPLDARTASR